MVKTGLIAIIVVVIIVVIVGGFFLMKEKPIDPETQQEGVEQMNSIEIKDFAFSPKDLTVKQGDTITWTNQDSAQHTVTSNSGTELDSELLSKGESYSHTFNTKGEFPYHCTPHLYMTGTITVE